jgi:archaellum component FlaC
MDTDRELLTKVVANIRFMHQKINNIVKEITSVRAEIRLINKQITAINERLDKLEN